MSHIGTGYDINQTFIIESLEGDSPIFSACTALYTNNILSCSGNTQIFLGNGVITFDGNLYTNDDLTANTINASTYYSGGTSLIDIIRLKNITGGTFNNTTDTLTLYKQDNSTVVVTGFTDYFTTGATLIGTTVYFDRNDALSAYTLNLSSFSADTYVTGVTFSNNQLIIGRNDGVNLNTLINTFTGLTINGIINANSIIANNISATTISASTFYGDGSNLTGISTLDTRISGFTYTPNTFTVFDTTGGTYSATINSVTGLTVNGVLTSNSISANTISATTFFGDGSNLTGISTQDTFVTGGTYSNGTAVFTNNTGGTFSVTGFYTGYTAPIDVFVTGGTYTDGTTIFTNNTGGTFSVSGFTTSFTGGTVSGSTLFTNGLTATTISATTYQNLPLDIHVTGFTFNNGDYNLTIKQNDGSTYTQSLSTLASDVTITGGTYNPITGIATFTNNTGGTFTVTGFLTGYTDTTISAFTYNNANTFRIDSTNGDSFLANINSVTGLTVNGSLSATTYLGLPIDIRVTGGTYSNGSATFVNNTGGTFNVSGFTTPFSGGSVTGLTATTISATTYLGLPSDIRTTGATYSNNTFTFTNNTGGTYNVLFNTVSGLTATTLSASTYLGLPTDIRITGGTYSNGTITFTNNTGGTFSVTGVSDTFVTGGTYSNNTGIATFTNNTGGTFNVSGFFTGSSSSISGVTGSNGVSASTTNNVTRIGFSGGTIPNQTVFTNGLTANTFSASSITIGPTTSGLTINGSNTGTQYDVLFGSGLATTHFVTKWTNNANNFGEMYYRTSGTNPGFNWNMAGAYGTTYNFNHRYVLNHSGYFWLLGPETAFNAAIIFPEYHDVRIKFRSRNSDTRYLRFTTDNISAVDTERFAIQGYVNSAIAYFTNVIGLTVGSTAAATEMLEVVGRVKTNHIVGRTSSPTISGSTGAGTGPTISINGTDLGGNISVTTGTSPATSSIVARVTFNTAYGATPKCVVLTPANSNSAQLSGTNMVWVEQSGITTTNFSITSGSAGLNASTAYQWFYMVIQ